MMGRWLVIAAVAVAGTPVLATAQTKTTNPHGELSLECSACHRADSWSIAQPPKGFRHADGRFALDGAHGRVACTSCHKSLKFTGVSGACASCHSDVHRGELGADCARCHSTRSFVDRAKLQRMHQLTRFPLAGAHLVVDCQQCHTRTPQGQLTFVGRSVACIACHEKDYTSVKDPDHVNGGFARQCDQCHLAVSWRRARFDHNGTRFPLTGAHTRTACAACHGDNVYRGKSTDCVSCHRTDYDRTTDPGHTAAGFPTTCASCHNTNAWTGATFDHNGTQFPLTGAHTRVACAQCHGDGVYKGKSTDCVSCHRSDYDKTTDPAHVAAGFPTTCTSCHTTTTWSGAKFDHDARYFPIYSGAHANRWTACSTCHTSSANYTQFTCLTCHEHDKTTMDAKHQGRAGYVYDSNACYTCHRNGRAG